MPRFSLSVLDLVPIGTGQTSSQALQNAVELARLAERLGYVRYWLAEHHGMRGIASSSPEVVIAHVAAKTERIRVGAGGIMLPNHAPLRVAEAFHTLEALHPGRIDLGIGRAPGTDPATSRALRPFDGEQFPALVHELLSLSRGDFEEGHPLRGVEVSPFDVRLPPVWILGSSGATARFAGLLGLGYGFASHFSPTPPQPAIAAYRESFRPSEWFERPHVIVGAAVVCAETSSAADRLATSMDLSWVRLHRGEKALFPSPEEAEAYPYTPYERALAQERRRLTVVGEPAAVAARLKEIAERTGADEIMVSSMIHDPEARLRSYELVAQALIG